MTRNDTLIKINLLGRGLLTPAPARQANPSPVRSFSYCVSTLLKKLAEQARRTLPS